MRDLTKEHHAVSGRGLPTFALLMPSAAGIASAIPSAIPSVIPSVIPFAVSVAFLFACSGAVAADFPVTPAQRAQADSAARQGIPAADLAAGAPSQYRVRKGDTLWGISSQFLRQPWRWPELWGMNRQQIRNPHLIYPGQVLYLIQRDGRAWLSTVPEADGVVRLSPAVRDGDAETNAIASIPAADIEPFLIRPLVVDQGTLDTAARIVALPEARVYMGRGDAAYARGIAAGAVGSDWQAYKPVVPVRDPRTGNVLGYEAQYQGNVRLVRGPEGPDAVSTVTVTQGVQEMGPGTLLMPQPAREAVRYVPHAPATAVNGAVAAVYGGVKYGGARQVVVLNVGSAAGLDPGTVLALSRAGGVVRDITDRGRDIALPDERYGLAFVFRVFAGLSYALVTDASNTVEVGDLVTAPH